MNAERIVLSALEAAVEARLDAVSARSLSLTQDLGMDSLDMAVALVEIEMATGRDIEWHPNGADLDRMTVGDLINKVAEIL